MFTTNTSIKNWSEEDRPREKMVLKGRQNLSSAELLAIVLGSGSQKESALGLAQRILNSVNHNLSELGRLTIADLMKFRGVGEAKAVSIQAVMEISRRRQLSSFKNKEQVRNSRDAFNLLGPIILDLPHEVFWVALLNRNNRVIFKQQLSIGGVTGTVIDARIVFRLAVEKLATGIILCHNHPSGNLQPSESDTDITRELVQVGKALKIKVMDHLIVSTHGYFSFADEGMIKPW